jgi:hypothetical protein
MHRHRPASATMEENKVVKVKLKNLLVWNLVFIVTDAVACLITGTSFSIGSLLVGWFWWNVAFGIVLAVAVSLKYLCERIVRFFRK